MTGSDSPQATEIVITVTPTIMDGTVVRWYTNLAAAENGREMASASRNRVMLDGAPKTIADVAYIVHAQLKTDPNTDDLKHLATHRHTSLLGHNLEPVEPTPPENVRLVLTGDRTIPVECRYDGIIDGMHHWSAVVPDTTPLAQIRQVTADSMPPLTSIAFDVT